jgi:ribosomal protein S7
MKKIEIKKKFLNHIMQNGKKKTSEKVLLQSFKILQKNCVKETQEIIKLAIIYCTPIFKLHRIKNKRLKKKNRKTKEIPSFITSSQYRISSAIKLILKLVKKKPRSFCINFNKEILLNSQKKGDAIQIKNELQNQVLKNRRYFSFYRWQ